jgi:anti-sigma B factor antagonist
MANLTGDGRCPLSQQEEIHLPIDVEVSSLDGQMIVSPRGEIDMLSAPLLWKRLAEVIPEARERLVIDLSETTFIDSTALAVFVRACKRVGHAGADFVLRAPNKSAQKILGVTGLDKVMTIEHPPPGTRPV